MIVAAHLGRPKGAPDPQYSLRPVADRLAQLLGRPVEFALDTVGESARLLAARPQGRRAAAAGERPVQPGRDQQGRRRAGRVRPLAGAPHRRRGRGRRVRRRRVRRGAPQARLGLRRRQAAAALLRRPGPRRARGAAAAHRRPGARPYVVVLGGSKVSDKLAVIESLLPKVDRLLVGGGMCFTFLAAQGHEVGDSLLEEDQIDNCRRLLAETGDKIVLPTDVVVAAEHHRGRGHADRRRRRDPGRPEGPGHRPGLGGARSPRRCRRADGVLERADGRLRGGRRSRPAPAASPRRSPRSHGLSVVGGGDSAAAVRALGLDAHALRAHLHRRRRVAGVPRGQDAARRCRSGRCVVPRLCAAPSSRPTARRPPSRSRRSTAASR